MTTWSRDGNANFDSFAFHVKLTPTQWHTAGKDAGHDAGGELLLLPGIFRAMKENDVFSAFQVARRATRTFFLPQIVINGEALPEELTTSQALAGLALGPQYDMIISFATKNEATLFKMSFTGGVNMDFGNGVN